MEIVPSLQRSFGNYALARIDDLGHVSIKEVQRKFWHGKNRGSMQRGGQFARGLDLPTAMSLILSDAVGRNQAFPQVVRVASAPRRRARHDEISFPTGLPGAHQRCMRSIGRRALFRLTSKKVCRIIPLVISVDGVRIPRQTERELVAGQRFFRTSVARNGGIDEASWPLTQS